MKIDSDKSWIFADAEIYKADIKKTLLRSHKPAVGDWVRFEITDYKAKTGLIFSFIERKKYLPKPKLANVDQVLVVTALHEPEFNSYLLNKYLFFLDAISVKPILIFTKTDLLNSTTDSELLKKIAVYHDLGYSTFLINNKNVASGDFEKLHKLINNKISVLVGQTGAGKSTVLNGLLNSTQQNRQQIKTQPISKALNRGKHTTTTTQFYNLNDFSFIADTPGFGNFDFKSLGDIPLPRINDLVLLKPYIKECSYPNCTHSTEQDCALDINRIPLESRFIYEDYCRLIDELKTVRGKTTWKKQK